MSETKKMVCADCGVEMNHHATKVDYSASTGEADASPETDTAGRLIEAHSCPECGKTALRDAGAPA